MSHHQLLFSMSLTIKHKHWNEEVNFCGRKFPFSWCEENYYDFVISLSLFMGTNILTLITMSNDFSVSFCSVGFSLICWCLCIYVWLIKNKTIKWQSLGFTLIFHFLYFDLYLNSLLMTNFFLFLYFVESN